MRSLLVTLVAAAVAVAAPAPAQAAPSTNASSTTASAIQSAAEYWTPERMKSATPADVPSVSVAPQAVPRPGPSGKHDGVAPSGVHASADVFTMTGRVFFVNDRGQNQSCSGSTVNSNGKRLVFTAGHCVHGGAGRGWFDVNRWVFVPGYNNGNRPHGTWNAYQQFTKQGWINGNRAFDVAAVVMQLLNGRRIVDAVGGQGIKWGAGYGLRTYMFGYPADPPFNGSTLYQCNGNTRNESGFPTLSCNMTGGASGGPWLENYGATFWAYVNGVNSWLFWQGTPQNVYKWQSPYFSYDTAGSLFDTVKDM
jgi:V8-like Glu-specific endopeptidase